MLKFEVLENPNLLGVHSKNYTSPFASYDLWTIDHKINI